MAAGATYTPIATVTGSNSSPEVSFSSIPSTYTDLVLVANIQPSNSAAVPGIYFNGTTSPTCSTTYLVGNGTSASSARTTGQGTIQPVGLNGWFSTTSPTTLIMQFQNYANTTTYKTSLYRYNNANTDVAASVGLWQSTNAINQITISTLNAGYYWNTTSTFTLYGIKAA